MRVLVAGGAGYIGSHVVLELKRCKHEVFVLDNLRTGHKLAVKGVPFIQGDIEDNKLVSNLIADNGINAAVHLAGESTVGVSMQDPGIFFTNNVGKGAIFLDTLVKSGVKNLVFSSSAAVYGNPEALPIKETHHTNPVNVYGVTKLMFENMMLWYEKVHGLRWMALRYFNAAGADYSHAIGEDHNPETHLIPLVLQTILGMRDDIHIFGNDYLTSDGTCIRDYVHVSDLSRAHVLALQALAAGEESCIYNLGSGRGFSVKEVIETCEVVTGHKVFPKASARRIGDPAILVASAEKIKSDLGWEPKLTNLEDIITSAWTWHSLNPHGYKNIIS